MEIKAIVFICIFMCFVACNHTNENEIEISSCVLDIKNIKEKDRILYSDIFKDVKIVPLETNDNCLVSRITNMRYKDNRFFILDPDQDIIFIFDNEGRYLNKINKKGEGPGEYIDIRGFDVDSKSGLICLSSYNKIIYYDYQGSCIKEEKLTYYCHDLVLSDQYIVAYTGYTHSYINGKEKDYMLVIKDRWGAVVNGYIPFDMRKLGGTIMTYQQSKAFARFKDDFLFFYPFSNNIYRIKGDSVSIKYTLNFGENEENNLPKDYFDNFATPEEAYENLENTSYAYGFHSFWENEGYFSINLNIGENPLTCLYNKVEKKMRVGYYSDDMVETYPIITDAVDEYVVGFKNANDIMEQIERRKKSGKKINEKVSELLTHIDEDSNPVIFLYYFK